ncbi:MAG: hypothetical protein ACI85I_002470 [Arenicella sp.]|jgi:hypothetical protein
MFKKLFTSEQQKLVVAEVDKIHIAKMAFLELISAFL